jgi:OmpA-OmpF porin, OOP family
MIRGQSVWGLSPRELVLAVALLLAAGPAGAQGVSLERLELNPGAAGSLLLGTGELLPQGDMRLSVVGHYQHNPYVLSRGGVIDQIVGNRLTTHLAAAYSLTNWLEVEAQVPVVAFQRGTNLIDKGIDPPVRYGLSTPRLGARWGLLSQRDGKWADLSLGLDVGLPVGNASGLSRESEAHVTPQLMFGRRLGWFRLALEARALLRKKSQPSADSTIERSEVGSELRFGVVAATVGRRLRWEFNVAGTVPLVNQPRSVELLVGPRYLVNPTMEVFALGSVGMGVAPGTPLFRVMVGTAFGGVTPPRLPGESSVNCSTDLKHTAEECPDLDEDADGVRNGLDRCPYEAGTLERSGCTRRDMDGDGIEDALDACPTEVGEAAWKGCPMPDDDGDGVDNERDSCPTVAGPSDSRGCPKHDQDEDGIEDDVDLCPQQKGEPKLQGCPESDRDGDTIANRFDSCPNVAGTVENHGCPPYELPMVTLQRARMDLMVKVLFVPSQPILDSSSHALLDWVVKVMKEHPEFPLVSVGAHTDNRGSPDANLQLSRARAVAVMTYLIQKGVAPERLEARGYGDTRPIASNATSFGREENRRVEFEIIWPD